MKYCKDCVGFDECKTTGRTVEFAVDDGVCIDFDERKPQTNAERIRSMSDEELCKFLGEYKFCDICEEGCDNCTYNGDCNKRLLEWLQQPAE